MFFLSFFLSCAICSVSTSVPNECCFGYQLLFVTFGAVAVPRTTSSFGDRSFAVATPRAWNNLPSPLRRVDSVNTFKRQLKTFLFAQAF